MYITKNILTTIHPTLFCFDIYIDKFHSKLVYVGLAQARPNYTSECKTLWGEPERVHRNMKQNIQATESTYAQHN